MTILVSIFITNTSIIPAHAVLMSIIFQHNKQLTTLMEQQQVNDWNRTAGTLDLWTQIIQFNQFDQGS